MKSKAQKTAAAKKNAEAVKAKKKAARTAKGTTGVAAKAGAKGKSAVPQANLSQK